MRNNWMFLGTLAAVFLLAAVAAPMAKADAPDPAVQQVQTFYDALLDSMKHAKTVDVNGRYKMLAPVIDATFDLPTMTIKYLAPL